MKKFAVFLVLNLCTFAALGDTVWLKSGDMLYGHIKLVDDDKLLLDTNYSHTISIDRAKLRTFSVTGPVEVKKGLFGKKQKAKKVLPGDEGTILLVLSNDEVQAFPLDEKFTLFLNHKKELLSEYLIGGHVTGGAYYDKGKNKTDQFYFDSQILARHDLWRHLLTGNMRRKTENSRSKTYNYTTGYAIDRFITPSFFWTTAVSYKRDWIEDIKSKFTVGSGPGYELWNNELGAFSLAGLVNYQHLQYRQNYSNNNPLGTIKWNYYRFFISKRLKTFTNGSIGRSFDNSVDLELTAAMGISYNFTRWFSINLTYSKDKSKTRDGDSSSSNYGIGMGVNW